MPFYPMVIPNPSAFLLMFLMIGFSYMIWPLVQVSQPVIIGR